MFFFSGWIEKNNILDYIANRDNFARKYKLAGIRKAIKEIDEYMKTAQVSLHLTFVTSMILLKIYLSILFPY